MSETLIKSVIHWANFLTIVLINKQLKSTEASEYKTVQRFFYTHEGKDQRRNRRTRQIVKTHLCVHFNDSAKK